jgi:Cdc6-like AAA superfamily ATPase
VYGGLGGTLEKFIKTRILARLWRAKREVERPQLVGRKQDILQLEILREHPLEEERPQLVSIIAPAGTGKTRLLEEFLDRLDANEGFQIATARCLPYGQTLTYWPLQGLLRELLGEEVTKERVVTCFTRGCYKADDAAFCYFAERSGS